MTSPSDSSAVHTSAFADSGQASAYRPMSGWAIVAFLLGLASAVALTHPWLLVVPVVAIGVAVWAWHRIAHAEPRPLGHRWVVAGLVVATFFLSAGTMRFFSRHRILHERATALCEDWIAALQRGEVYRAYSMMRLMTARPATEEAAKSQVDDELTRMAFRKFSSEPAVTTLRSERDLVRVHFVRETAFVSSAERDQFAEVFEISHRGPKGDVKQYLQFVLERLPPAENFPRERWQIHQVNFVSPRSVE